MVIHIKEFLKLKYPKLNSNSLTIGYFDIDDNSGKTLAHVSKNPDIDNFLHIHLTPMFELMDWFSIDRQTSIKYIQNHILEIFKTKSVDALRNKLQTIYENE